MDQLTCPRLARVEADAQTHRNLLVTQSANIESNRVSWLNRLQADGVNPPSYTKLQSDCRSSSGTFLMKQL